jgi:UDP-apiose/xylose synthase
MKILTLGAGGFIGAHLTEKLLKEGHEVVGVDIHHDKIEELLNHPALEFIKGDIRNHSLPLDAWIQSNDLVIDLIAHANPGLYVRQPLDVFRLNFNENLRIAEHCVKWGKRLIQFSSCEVYGKTIAAALPGKIPDPENPDYATFSEDTTNLLLGPVGKHRWIYACAKQLLERVLHAYGLEGKLNYTIIRPFNFLGPKIDYLPSDTTSIPRVFSHFMEALLRGGKIQLVDGGHHRRCYTYIDDAIDCIYRIVENPGGVCDREIFNVGSTHNEVTIREMAELMLDIYQTHFKVEDIPLPEIVEVTADEFYGHGYEDSDRRIPDNRKARTLLGWEPVWTMRPLLMQTMAYYVHEYGH